MSDDRWWIWRDGEWTEVEVGELPREGEIAYVLHADDDPNVVLGRERNVTAKGESDG